MEKVSESARKLKALRVEAGMTVDALASALDMPKSTYSSKEDKFKRPFFPMDFVKSLVPIFKTKGIEERRVMALAGVDPAQPSVDHTRNASAEGLVATPNRPSLEFLPGARPTLTRDLPIRGHTKAGETGFFFDQGEARGFAMRPESLRGVDQAYAVRVHDDCMVPRYKPGTVLQIDPFRHAAPGDNVVIQLNDGQCFVKELVRRAGGLVECRQFNPDIKVSWKQAEVRSVHLVVGVDYLER